MALWPGAGSSADHPSLRAVHDALAPLPVERFDWRTLKYCQNVVLPMIDGWLICWCL